MTTQELAPLVEHIHAAVARERSDEELLRAFAAGRDQSAFTAIVRRYGTLVLGVCRRALRHEQDAEDAFQAVFLVLARNAASIRKGRSLSSWLHGVSYRISLKARQAAARQRALIEQADQIQPTPLADELSWREVQAALDEEVRRLPELYREPFILCCLEGRSRAEASTRLNIKEGTLSSRLAEGRKRVQYALQRRGVALSAVPAVLVPAGLARSAVQVAFHSSEAGTVPAAVLNLAQGVTSTMTRSMTRVAIALVLAVGVLACASGLLPRPPRAEARFPAAPAAKKAPETEEGATIDVKGRVLLPDGKPAKGASLFFRSAGMSEEKARQVRATADRKGQFHFRVSSGQLQRDAKLIATLKGVAPTWEDLSVEKAKQDMVLTLRSDDVPFTGQLLNLEGQPLEGITVEIMWVGQHREDQVADWIDHFVGMHRKGYWINEDGLRIVPPRVLGLPGSVKTGKDGRFRVTGFGKDRVLTIVLRSERTVATRLQVPLRVGPKMGWVKGDHGLYPTDFTFLLGPGKTITGTVRDRKTGKPIAGILVAHSSYHARATTNDRGEYRIVGAPKQPKYMMALGGRKGVPYIDYTQFDIADTPGLDPVKLDFELERGVEISGKVIDKVSGKPVSGGRVGYFHAGDNPNVKDFATLTGAKFIISQWGQIGHDGSFTVLGIPGPGALVVLARDSTRYVRLDVGPELRRLKVNGSPIGATHAVFTVDASEDDPKTRTCTIHVTASASRPVLVQDPDGKPIRDAQAAGLRDSEMPTKLTSDRLTITGLPKDSTRARAVVILHPERNLGGVASVSSDSDRPVEVKLQPLGTLSGRLVDDDGKPLPGRKVLLFLFLDAKKFENLPKEWCPFDSLITTAWREFTTREVTTDKDGRFTVTGLLPGERYDLNAAEGQFRRRAAPTHRYRDFRVESGKVKDVGDLKPQRRPR
jgi:RNA polymerase sigma factor (sigma-70 family)